MFGYDWPQLHAALNDAPAALLVVSVLFDIAGTVMKRDSFRTVGLWTLVTGALGGIAAVIAGLVAEGRIDHSDAGHALMERHEAFALAATGVFALLALWRVWRRGSWRPKEAPVALVIGVVGVGLMIYTAQLGGRLVFEHALGIPTTTLHTVQEQREGEHEHAPGESDMHGDMPGDSARSGTDSSAAARAHTHADGTTDTHPTPRRIQQ